MRWSSLPNLQIFARSQGYSDMVYGNPCQTNNNPYRPVDQQNPVRRESLMNWLIGNYLFQFPFNKLNISSSGEVHINPIGSCLPILVLIISNPLLFCYRSVTRGAFVSPSELYLNVGNNMLIRFYQRNCKSFISPVAAPVSSSEWTRHPLGVVHFETDFRICTPGLSWAAFDF